MARLRESFGSHANLAHVWASGKFPRGHSGDRRMLFEGATIFSYRTNWPMAVLFTDRNGVRQVLMNDSNYSVSTSKHMGLMRDAVSHLPGLARIGVNELKGFSNMVESNGQDLRTWPDSALARLAAIWNDKAASFARYIVEAEGKISRARKSGPWLREQLIRDIDSCIALGAAFGFPDHSFGDLESLRAQIAAEEEARKQAERERATKIAAEMEALESLGLVKDWQAHGDGVKHPQGDRVLTVASVWQGRTLLRRSRDGAEVETSRGARVPWLEALKLYTFAKRVEGKGWSPPPNVSCGPYHLTSIDRKGNVKIGCHDLLMVEMQALAEREGVAI